MILYGMRESGTDLKTMRWHFLRRRRPQTTVSPNPAGSQDMIGSLNKWHTLKRTSPRVLATVRRTAYDTAILILIA
jgi:hypothetical protein